MLTATAASRRTGDSEFLHEMIEIRLDRGKETGDSLKFRSNLRSFKYADDFLDDIFHGK